MASDNGIIHGGGKVVLPLVALGGIALWINCYYYRKRSSSQEEEADDDSKEDYLSQLPDDVLSSILGNLTVRDAARTSILSTRGVVLTSGRLEGIMSSCSNLKKLTIYDSILPYKLRLAGTVTNVVILDCHGGEEIDLHAAYLHTLECKTMNNVRFFFSFVPILENVMVCPWRHPSYSYRRPSYSYIFGDCARDLPDQVKSLTLEFGPDEVSYFPIENPTEMKMFRNLRKLSLTLATSHAILEIFELSRLLGDFPLLQYLSFVVIKISRMKEIRGSRRPPSSPTCHIQLKQVTYGGFYGSEAEMKLVLYILKSAIVLEQMFLSPGYKRSFWSALQTNLNVSFDERKRNAIQRKLHGQAISRKAVVIIQ